MYIEMKTCSKCGEKKALCEFPKSGGKGGLSSWCRACHSARYALHKKTVEIENMNTDDFDPISTLNTARIESKTTIRAIADALGVNEINVGKWFNRKTIPRQKNLIEMYKFLGLTIPSQLERGKDGRIPLGVARCECCGKNFPLYAKGRKFCSRECQGKTLSQRQLGVNNARWKGGQYVTGAAGGGYLKEMCPNHSKADASGYVLQHRLVIERLLGRELLSTEHVHHKNGDRKDNRPENLELWQGAGKKDPKGVRAIDAARNLLNLLSAEDRATLLSELKV